MKVFTSPSATITVSGVLRQTVVVSTVGGEATFAFDRSGREAARWLSRQELGGRVRAGMTWEQLEAAVEAPRAVVAPVVTPAVVQVPKATTEEVARLVEKLVTQRLEEVLEAHYREVLGSPTGRAMWRKLLRDHSTLEKAAKVTKEAGR